MTWMSNVTHSVTQGVQGVACGVWAAVATPFVYRPLRPLTKQAVKGSLWMARGAQSLFETTQSEWSAVVEEARLEARSGTSARALVAGSRTQTEAERANGSPGADDASDLTIVKGIGDDYARLLHEAGIGAIPALADADPEALRRRLHEANDEHGIVSRVPSTDRIQDWIDRAGARGE